MTNNPDGISAQTVEAVALYLVEKTGGHTVTILRDGKRSMGVNLRGTIHIPDFIDQIITSGEIILRTNHEAEMQKVRGNYSAWLIEQRDANGKPTWLCNPHYPEFTDNAWKALHYGRQEDAEAYADSDGSDYVLYITEHEFPALSHFTTNHATTGEK